MNTIKLYLYFNGVWTRDTVSLYGIPEDEKKGSAKVAWGDEELQHLYATGKVKYDVLKPELNPMSYNCDGTLTQEALRKVISMVAPHYNGAACDILENNDENLSPARLSCLQRSVCRGIKNTLNRLGVEATLVSKDVSGLNGGTSELKTWHTVRCHLTTEAGRDIPIDIMPLYKEYMKRCKFETQGKYFPSLVYVFDNQGLKVADSIRNIEMIDWRI